MHRQQHLSTLKNKSYGKEKREGRSPHTASRRERADERHRVHPRQDGTDSAGRVPYREGRRLQDCSGRQGAQELLSENRPLRRHVRELPEKFLEPAQGPDPLRHHHRQGGGAGQP